MNVLNSLLRHTYARSTHHFFALDAIPLMQTAPGKRLARMLLCRYDKYLTGATDPDTRFCDFQNHVLHADEGYWGGATRVASAWYGRLQKYIRQRRWNDAAHAAGVLSHYFTDVLQPLHTQVDQRERVLHGPIERSIYRSYDEILRGWKDDEMRVVFQLADREGWLTEAMLHSARFAHRKRESLLGRFSVESVSDPDHGLDVHCRASLAELFGLAITGTARILERAAAEAETNVGHPLPRFTLIRPWASATAWAPFRLPWKWIVDREGRLEAEAMIREYVATGVVTECLPQEVDITHRVVKVYHDEQRWKEARQSRLRSKLTVVGVQPSADQRDESERRNETSKKHNRAGDPTGVQNVSHAKDAFSSRSLVEAPSIGPKTAARLAEIQIETIDQFLSLAPEVIASRLQTYWITGETIRFWQAQARLKCQLTGISDTDAQLLAGAGYDSAESLTECETTRLHEDVQRFAMTSTGRRYRKGSKPPSRAQVARWVLRANLRSADPATRRKFAA